MLFLPAEFSDLITALSVQRIWPPALISPCFFIYLFIYLISNFLAVPRLIAANRLSLVEWRQLST